MRAVVLCLPSLWLLGLFPCESLSASFPGPAITDDIRFNQERADEAFEANRYDEAYRIYERELVSNGDKFAQYRIGWMHWRGLGVKENRVEAAAWFRLAAERGDPDLIELRDGVDGVLTPEEAEQANGRFDSSDDSETAPSLRHL